MASLRSALALLPIERFRNPPPVVSVLRLHGVIGRMGALRGGGLTLAGLADAIERAFSQRDLKAVALSVNSPGGSPVQSSLIAGRIRQLAEEKKVPVIAFCEDVAASGGYWLACAADEIYADHSSIVGSIGVIAAGFGFSDLLQRIGVERRVYTAGERKGMLDPFRPEQADDIARLKELQADIHESFIAHVRDRRNGRLKGEENELFSGAFWTGRRALEYGLVDGVSDLRSEMRRRFGENVRLRVVGLDRRWWRLRFGLAARPENPAPPIDGWVDGVLGAIEERLWWSRYGL